MRLTKVLVLANRERERERVLTAIGQNKTMSASEMASGGWVMSLIFDRGSGGAQREAQN